MEEAGRLARTLRLGDESFLRLRNATVSALALVDLRWDKRWPGHAPRNSHIRIGFDGEVERYARLEPGSRVVVRSMIDNRELISLDGIGDMQRKPYLCFSPDGNYLAALGYSESIGWRARLWDLRQPDEIILEAATPARPSSTAIAFSPDSRSLAYTAEDHTIRVYDIPQRSEANRFFVDSTTGWLSFRPDGRQLATSVEPTAADSRLIVLDAGTGLVVAQCQHPASVVGGAWSPDGRRIATACSDFQVYLWHPETSATPLVFNGHRNRVGQVAFNHRGDLLMSTAWDGTTILWEASTGARLLRTVERGAGFSRDDRWLAMGLPGVAVGRWEVANSDVQQVVMAHRDATYIYSLDFSPDGRLLASAGLSDGIAVWDMETRTKLAHIDLFANSVMFAPDGKTLFVGGGRAGIQSWPIVASERSGRKTLRMGPPRTLADGARHQANASLSRDGRFVVANVSPDSAVIIDTTDTAKRTPLQQTHVGLRFHDVSPDNRLVATGTWSGTGVKIWNAKSGAAVQELPVQATARVKFSPCGRWLATCSFDQYVLWEVGSWKQAMRLDNEGFSYAEVAFRGDGELMAAMYRQRVKLIDPTSGREIATLESPSSEDLKAVCFSPDGRWLAVGTMAGRTQLWDLALLESELRSRGLQWERPLADATLADAAVRSDAGPLRIRILQEAPNPALSMRRQHEARLAALKTKIKGSPGDARLYAQRGQSHYALQDDRSAEQDFSKAIELQPEDSTHYWWRVQIRIRLGRYQLAAEDGQRLIELNPNVNDGYFWRARAMMLLERDEVAIAGFRKSLELTPVDDWAHQHLAWLYATAAEPQRDLDAALTQARRAVALQPEFPAYLTTLGVIQYRLGEYQSAIDTLESAEPTLSETVPIRLLFLAMSYQQLADEDEARRLYEESQTYWDLAPGLLYRSADLIDFLAEAREIFEDSSP